VSESLPRRLLRLSSSGLPLILSGRALQDHVGPEVDRALYRRVLVELPALDEWPPCGGCDRACEARPIREQDGRLIAMCPHDATADEVLSADDVRQFRLEAEELCLALREDSSLGGDGPKEVAPGIWLVGQMQQRDAHSRVVLVAFEVGAGATSTIATLKRVAGSRPVSFLLAGESDLEFRLALEDAGVAALPASEPLIGDTAAPFRLDTGLLASTERQPRLILRRSDRSAAFEGASGILPPQPFKLLHFMLMETEAGRPLIDNRLIERELWGTAIHGRQVSDAIRRLRDALTPVLGGRDQADRLIQNQPGSYLINREFVVIEII
jgi:hypothetical protein